jgi:hypothetical protein
MLLNRSTSSRYLLILANKSWKENESHVWFLERPYLAFHHGIVPPEQEGSLLIGFLQLFVHRNITFIVWLVEKGKTSFWL